MLNFLSIPPDIQKEFIENGQVDDLLNDLFKNFWGLPAESQYALIKRARQIKDSISIDVLKETFKCSEDAALGILTNEATEVHFPVVGESEKAVAKALIIKETPSLITNLPFKEEELRTFGENFSVFFDRVFEGKSYMLAVGVGLRCKYVPKDLAFTGIVDPKGHIHPVDKVAEKREVCRREGYRLVSPYDLKEKTLQYIVEWLSRESLDIPYYFTTSKETAQTEFKKLLKYVQTDPKALELFYGIGPDLTLQSTGRLEGEIWLKAVNGFHKKISKLLYGEKKRHFHLAGRMPASLSFAFGILFGSQTPFTFYHFQNQEYIPIAVTNVRNLKERIDPEGMEDFYHEYIPGGDELVILVGGAFHAAGTAVKEFMKGERYTYLLTEHKRSGNLSPQDMVEFARAVSSIIQKKRGNREFRRYHFFFSCPLPVAFMVGVSFGHYASGSIYNYEQEKGIYSEVLKIEDLRRIREGS
ncbi:SAVED domain-containing protein [Aquifex sp.]